MQIPSSYRDHISDASHTRYRDCRSFLSAEHTRRIWTSRECDHRFVSTETPDWKFSCAWGDSVFFNHYRTKMLLSVFEITKRTQNTQNKKPFPKRTKWQWNLISGCLNKRICVRNRFKKIEKIENSSLQIVVVEWLGWKLLVAFEARILSKNEQHTCIKCEIVLVLGTYTIILGRKTTQGTLWHYASLTSCPQHVHTASAFGLVLRDAYWIAHESGFGFG